MRIQNFDVLKAVAIIAVVLYHVGTCKYGYLGVDVFLVIAGYFTSKSINNQLVNGGGKYFRFIRNRLFRLWPLLLIAETLILIFGWMMTLPDDYENTAQSVVATNFFGNNILQAITTADYWDIANEYKPLMHTWYVGLIMQFYMVVPFILFASGHMIKGIHTRQQFFIGIVSVIGIVSFIMFLTCGTDAERFYFLPYRLYEFCSGALAYYCFGRKEIVTNKSNWTNWCFVFVYLAVIVLLFVEYEFISPQTRLITVVILSSLLLAMMTSVGIAKGKIFTNKGVATIGAASFSIFVWHQVVLAYMRYSFTNKLSEILPILTFVIITAILSLFSYKYIERMKQTKWSWSAIFILLATTTIGSLYIYVNAGVVRDVPELEVRKGNGHRGMWAEYNDRAFQYDKDFSNSELQKWYVIGNSFGRDWVNIILESPCSKKVEVVYSFMGTHKDRKERFAKADVVFLSSLGIQEKDIEEVRSLCTTDCRFFVIGEKNFGESNGQVYRHRFDTNYHNMTIAMSDGYAEKNERLKAAYPNIFIDLIEIVRQSDGKVRVFTDDGRFISQDCCHLTKAGAQFYAKKIDWNQFLK